MGYFLLHHGYFPIRGISFSKIKKETWFLNGTYKHQWMGCGFEGEKLKERKNLAKQIK